jgi:hypothetical protein
MEQILEILKNLNERGLYLRRVSPSDFKCVTDAYSKVTLYLYDLSHGELTKSEDGYGELLSVGTILFQLLTGKPFNKTLNLQLQLNSIMSLDSISQKCKQFLALLLDP